MKNLLCLTVLCFFFLPLLLAQKIDKTAATQDIIMGFTDEFDDLESNKKYFSKDLEVFWPGGGKSGFEGFWNHYSSSRERAKHEPSDVVIRELDNETYAFFTWKSTIRKNNNHPEAVGKSATGTIAYRMVWEDDQIREWHIFFDSKSRDKQLGINP